MDGGYTNGEDFWLYIEYFNMKHSSARNVIERCFGFLKMRWAILYNCSWYKFETHVDIISTCFLHNLIGRKMEFDPLKLLLDIEYGRHFTMMTMMVTIPMCLKHLLFRFGETNLLIKYLMVGAGQHELFMYLEK